MMYIQSRKRKLFFPFSSCLSNSFVFSSLHFPFNLNCQSICKRKRLTHSEDPNSGVSSSLTAPHGRDHERGDELPKGNTYEVFLSFRGIDTRKGITDYLYTSLVNAGIHVFKDDNELRVGEEIGPELLYSITQSTISIPIISENYVSSKWCLRELVQMLKCKRSKGQKVLPIFYKVEPHQVRHLTGRLRKAIDAHKKNTEEMVVKEWEEALKEVSSLKGWESEKIDNGLEGTLIKIIVKEVLGKLSRLFQLNVPEQLVGIEDHVQQIMSNIDAESNGTKIIRICGMGGIGKTTLAKVLYNRLSSHFDCRSFLANIRETSQRKGIECVQKQLIYDITRSSWDVSNVDEGVSVIKSRFMRKKVLVLLDDMDDSTHLNALVKDGSWFEVGSLVIITTRNKSILDEGRASYMYQLNELSLDQSLILFSRHAFRKDYPPSDYEGISRDVVSTTGGLPLALEVIGSFLCRKGEKVWKDTLKKLEKIPDKKVQETLKISYEALDHEEKQIFLDIACFFSFGSSKKDLTCMWDACGLFPERGIKVLSLMSLIKIDEYGKLMMHDQLRDLGREIVHLENPNEPQERSRVWNHQEALDVLDNNEGTRKIEALSLGKCGEGRRYVAKQFKKMTNLRFLQVDGVNFIGDFQNLLPKLRWLQWEGCPSNFAAVNFHPKKLVVLDLSYSAISEDWGGWDPLKMATELKVLNLTNCQALKRTPDLSIFKRLEILTLRKCENLEELHPSIGNLASLIELDLSWTLITKLPESIGNLQNLRVLNSCLTGIIELPESIGAMKELKVIKAIGCRKLAHIPSSIGNLASLQRLELYGCRSLIEILNFIGNLASLIELDLSWTLITKLPESIGNLQNLRTLFISNSHITELPDAIGMLTELQKLEAMGCENLEQLPSNMCKMISLKGLNLSNCKKLQELPELPSGLINLGITCQGQSLPHLPQLTRLETLSLEDCHRLECVPELPIGLSQLFIWRCGKLKALTNLSDLKHLRHFSFSECPSLEGSPDVSNFRRPQMRELGFREYPMTDGLIFKR